MSQNETIPVAPVHDFVIPSTSSLTLPKPYFERDGIAIYHGDCRELLEPLGRSDMALISDPPYGINAVLGMGGGTNGNGGMWSGVYIAGDDDTTIRDWACSLFESWAVFGSPRRAAPAGTKATVVWDKGEHTGAGDLKLPWKPSFELVFIGGRDWSGRRGGGVVRFNAVAGCVGNRNTGARFHPFEKPVGVMRHFVGRSEKRIICDPFMGAGTTLVAAKLEGRQAVGIEINEAYCEIAAKRLAQQVLF